MAIRDEAKPWAEARTDCQNAAPGGELLSIHDHEMTGDESAALNETYMNYLLAVLALHSNRKYDSIEAVLVDQSDLESKLPRASFSDFRQIFIRTFASTYFAST